LAQQTTALNATTADAQAV